jgi:hypothetical protein
MDYETAIARIYDHLEANHVEQAVMACLRVARHAKDYLNAAIFLRELYPNRKEVVSALYDDISHLNKDAQKLIFEMSLQRWIDLHTMDFTLGGENEDNEEDGARHNILNASAGELDAKIAQWEGSIEDMAVSTGMAPFDTAAFTDRMHQARAMARLQITALQTARARLKARCLNYAIQIERQFELQRKTQGFLESVQNDVNNFFKVRSDDVYTKLQKAAQLSMSDDLEDFPLLLTQVRRALKGAADFFYPPVSGTVMCSDGKERELGEEQYLNRLQEFLASRITRSTAKDLLRAELEHLGTFFRRLNDMASKGVHSAVSVAEAKQGLVGLYFFLFNLSQHLSRDSETASQD